MSSTQRPDLDVQRLGRIDWAEAHRLQLDLVEARACDEIGDTLLLCEHDPVITVGRGVDETVESTPNGPPIVHCERGGEATWHGPGQITGYWIRALPPGRRDLHAHLRTIETRLIGTIATFGIEGRRREGLTGVFVGEKKVASIGIAVRRWVTFHGFGLNVAVDPDVWTGLRPCGLAAEIMGDLKGVAAVTVDANTVMDRLERVFTRT